MKTITLKFAGFSFAVALMMFLATSLTVSAAINQQLDIGDQGSDVTELQQFLASYPALYPEGLVTGYFGPLTQAAVQRFQCEQNIVCSGNPTSTGYGRVGPSTLARIHFVLGTGVSIPGTSDVYAPIMSQESLGVTSNSATINWTTTEPAVSKVMYGTSYPFLYATAPSVSDSSVNSSSNVTLTGLQSNRLYYYVRESIDEHGNIMWTTAKTFITN